MKKQFFGKTEGKPPVRVQRVVGPTRTDGAITILTWRCKCHGWKYADPRQCLHTDESNLIPPDAPPSGPNEKLCNAAEKSKI